MPLDEPSEMSLAMCSLVYSFKSDNISYCGCNLNRSGSIWIYLSLLTKFLSFKGMLRVFSPLSIKIF